MSKSIPCTTCGGEGRVEASRYGGNDPDTWLIRCDACNGSGHERCCECRRPATDAWIEPEQSGQPERSYFLCDAHMQAYQTAAADE